MSEYDRGDWALQRAPRGLVSQLPGLTARSPAEHTRDLTRDKLVSFERTAGNVAVELAAMQTAANVLEKSRDAQIVDAASAIAAGASVCGMTAWREHARFRQAPVIADSALGHPNSYVRIG